MRATVMYKAGDVRVEDVPDPVIKEPSDAIVRITRSCICGSDLWPYQSMPAMEHGRRMGHEFIGVVEDTGAAVLTLKRGDLVVARSCGPTTPVISAVKVCTSRAATEAAGARRVWMPAKARPFAFLRREARWSSYPSPRIQP
jgi:threonine dehydrogenase-like Zn-dependent dehydrogenase